MNSHLSSWSRDLTLFTTSKHYCHIIRYHSNPPGINSSTPLAHTPSPMPVNLHTFSNTLPHDQQSLLSTTIHHNSLLLLSLYIIILTTEIRTSRRHGGPSTYRTKKWPDNRTKTRTVTSLSDERFSTHHFYVFSHIFYQFSP